MKKLQWPPTAYGEMVYTVVMDRVKTESLSKKDAADMLDGWFTQEEDE